MAIALPDVPDQYKGNSDVTLEEIRDMIARNEVVIEKGNIRYPEVLDALHSAFFNRIPVRVENSCIAGDLRFNEGLVILGHRAGEVVRVIGPLEISNSCITGKTDGMLAEFRDVSFANSYLGPEVSFAAAKFGDRIDFSGATFGGRTNFRSATFGASTSFSNAAFGLEADFGEASFGPGATFLNAEFGERGSFRSARFGDRALFQGTTFGNDSSFSRARFTGEVSFMDATFGVGTSFAQAVFDGLTFLGARFGDKALFERAHFYKRALFNDATFGDGVQFRHTIFNAGALFDRATFKGQVVFQGHEAMKVFKGLVLFILVSLEAPEKVIFQQANLSHARFLNTRLDKIQFTDVKWADRGGRKAIYDEDFAKEEGYELVAQLYRQLKKNYEEQRDYPGAGDFHYGEMEMTRKQQEQEWKEESKAWPKFKKWFAWFLTRSYKFLSGYGEKVDRAIVITLAILLAGVPFYFFDKLTVVTTQGIWSAFWDGLVASMGYMTFRLSQPPTVLWAKPVMAIQAILGPVQLALTALALRRRFRR